MAISAHTQKPLTAAVRLKAVLFDLDGTLVDSEPLWHEVDKAWLESHGIRLSPEEWLHIVGKGGGPFVRELMEHKGLEGDFHALLQEKNNFFREQARTRSQAFPEMLAFVRLVREAGLQTAVASASSLEIISTTLECIGALELFDGLYSGDQVERSKPDPMLFTFAAERLGVRPDECLVLEDSQYGVQAGVRAGMTVVGVPHQIHHETAEHFALAHRLYREGMREFSARDLANWLQSRNYVEFPPFNK